MPSGTFGFGWGGVGLGGNGLARAGLGALVGRGHGAMACRSCMQAFVRMRTHA